MDTLTIQSKIKKRTIDNFPQMLKTLSELIQIPSVTGNEGDAQKYIQELYDRLGLKVVTFEPDVKELAHHSYYSRILETDFKGRPNVLGILEGNKTSLSIKLNAHVDTVPPDPVDQWKDSPFSGKVDRNRVYGRGALDDKSGLVTNYYALKAILDVGYKPAGMAMLESAVEEEGGGAGSLTTLLRGYITDGMVVNDGPPGVLIANTGSIGRLNVRVIGRTMHAGWADYGVNAILKMNTICAALDELGRKRTQEKHLAVLETPTRPVSCTHNISMYRAGDNPSSVPGWAEITAGFLIIPGESIPEVRKQVEDVINAVADSDEWLKVNRPQITWVGKGYHGWLQDEKHPFVQTALQSTEKVIGHKIAVSGMTAGSDASLSQYFNAPAILTGPVGISHAIDEYVETDSLIVNAQILAMLIIDWCGVEKV